jgi:chromate reductase, NAD(P)H dehydrogenase (quinone)
MAGSFRVLGISGSLRQGSFNAAALRAAVMLAPAGMTIETAALRAIPLYDQDEEARGFPEPVRALGAHIRQADGVLIVTPEYNYSVPGVLKNAIDWVSRLPEAPFADKPVAIMGASPGMLGTARAQYHLRQSFVFLRSHVLASPEVMIPAAHQKFDAQGNLTDDATRGFIVKLLEAFAGWISRLRSGRAD